jgi:hypothetical protein
MLAVNKGRAKVVRRGWVCWPRRISSPNCEEFLIAAASAT